jgi:hypothetical protein
MENIEYEVTVIRKGDTSSTVAHFVFTENPDEPVRFLSAPDPVTIASIRRGLDELEDRAMAASRGDRSGRPVTKAKAAAARRASGRQR